MEWTEALGEPRWTRDARQRGGEHAIKGVGQQQHARTHRRPPASLHSCSLWLSPACMHDPTSLSADRRRAACHATTEFASIRRQTTQPPRDDHRRRTRIAVAAAAAPVSQIVALFKAGGEGRMPSQNRLATAFREPSAPAIGSDHADSLSLPPGARVHAPVDEGYHLVRSPPHQEPHALPSLRSSLVPQAAQVVRFVRLPGGQAPVVYVSVVVPSPLFDCPC